MGLLDGDGSTFLERGVALLREAGADRLVVGVKELRGPVHAAVLASGAHPIVAPQGNWLKGVAEAIRWARTEWGWAPPADPHDASGSGLPPCLIYLPVDRPRVKDATVRALVEVFRDTRPPPALVRPVHRGRAGFPVLLGSPGIDALVTLSAGDRDLPPESGAGEAGMSALLDSLESKAIVVETSDPGVGIRIGSVPEYRRHFPRSFRKRFQKW